jgi:hypothetical protein
MHFQGNQTWFFYSRKLMEICPFGRISENWNTHNFSAVSDISVEMHIISN